MLLKPTTLIICANLDDLQKKRRVLVEKYEKKENFVKWSDTAVELENKLFILKVINIQTDIIDAIKGYDNVEPNHLLSQIYRFIEEIKEILGINETQSAKASPKPPQSPENDEETNMNSDTKEEQKNDKEEQKNDKNEQ